MPSQHCADLWTGCGGSPDSNPTGPTPVRSCFQCPQLSELVRFLCGSSQWPFKYSIDTVCLADRVDLICRLCSWWEGLGNSSLSTLPLGFYCVFISISACGPSTGVCPWGCPGGPGLAPVRAKCGDGAAAWVAGVLAAPGAQGSWQLKQQEI